MTKVQELQIKQSETREKINGLLAKESRTEAEDTELRELTTEAQRIEPELRAALAVEDDTERRIREAGALDTEARERIELRGRARLSRFLSVNARGALPDGAEAELSAAAGINGAEIPLELWEPSSLEEYRARHEAQERQLEARAVTPAPTTGTGVMIQPIQPAIFSPSIAGMLRVDMPAASSGGYGEMVIGAAPDAEATAKGTEKTASAGVLQSRVTNAKRITAALETALEDAARVGTDTFEAALRAAVSMALSNQLDEELVNGDDSGARLNGLLAQLDAPDAPTAVASFDELNAAVAERVDGIWAESLPDVRVLLAADAWQLAAKLFRDGPTDDRGAVSAASYLGQMTAGFKAAARLITASNVSDGIAVRLGFPGLRVACCPTWGSIAIDDIYTKSGAGTRVYVLHVLCGDVLINYPAAFSRLAVKVA